MLRSIFTFSALALTATAATAATASSYSAKPAAPTTERFITRDITWNCTEAACQGATQESRPLVLCQSLAKRAGRLESFAVDGRALAAAELDRCNASAKAQGSKALATQ
ncbi:hypothetical protein GCM10022276_16370 [Sphingomonas limnosediminicola]|uniref:Secreted protein n=1 Tax=Sphingomonas limnosediminicola TaxID=940133 RepID=A0ABP7LCN0_9SPHN